MTCLPTHLHQGQKHGFRGASFQWRYKPIPVLSDRSILREIEAGNLIIDPLPTDEDFSASTVNVHLGDIVRTFKVSHEAVETIVDVTHRDIHTSFDTLFDTTSIPSRGYLLKPNEFLLSYTREHIKLPAYIAARLEGRSTIARYGVSVQNAPTVQPFWDGNLVLEIRNLGKTTIRLLKDMPIAQLIFEYIDTPPLRTTLDSVWQGQRPPNLSDITN